MIFIRLKDEHYGKDISYYISMGFDPATAEYFANGRRTITEVKPKEDYTLVLTFDDGDIRVYNMKPYLRQGTIFEHLISFEAFARVYLDENHCVSWDIDSAVDSRTIWSNKIDLCSDACYINSVSIRETKE